MLLAGGTFAILPAGVVRRKFYACIAQLLDHVACRPDKGQLGEPGISPGILPEVTQNLVISGDHSNLNARRASLADLTGCAQPEKQGQ